MGRRKKLPKIDVRTLPNGYSLAIEGHRQEYMYYTPEALLKEHVRWKKKVTKYRTEGVQLKMEFKK